MKSFSQFRITPFAAVWLLTFAVRFLLLLSFSHSPEFVPNAGDMRFYHDWGVRILGGQWTDGRAFYGLPGYAYALAVIYSVSGVSPFAVGLIQCVFEAFTAYFIVRIGDRVFNRWVGLLAALGWILCTPAQAYSVIIMPTSWIITAFWGVVWWLVKTEKRPAWHAWLWIGLLAGFAGMFVATIFVLMPLVVVAIVLHVRKPLAIIGAVALLLTGLYAGCAPAWWHNYFVAHDPVLLSAHSGLNYYIGNNPVATGYPKIPPGLDASQEGLLRDSITLAERAQGRKLLRSEVSAHWSARAKEWISENRPAWWRLLARKAGNFWNTYQYDDVSAITLLREEGVLPPGLRFGAIAALALPGLILGVVLLAPSRWIAGAILLHFAAILPVFVTERYRLCAVPGLLLFASYGLAQVWRWVVDRRWLTVAAYGGMLALSVWGVTLSRGDIGLWSLEHYNAGIRAFNRGDIPKAERELGLARAYVDDNADIHFAMGNLLLAQGKRGEAKLAYRKVIDLNPSHASAWNNLGVLAVEEKLWPFAVRCLEIAIKLEPEDAKTYFLLARARQGAGNLPGARAALAKALELRPEQPEFLALRATLDAPPAP